MIELGSLDDDLDFDYSSRLVVQTVHTSVAKANLNDTFLLTYTYSSLAVSRLFKARNQSVTYI